MILNKAYLKKVYDELSPEEKSKYEEELNKDSTETPTITDQYKIIKASDNPIKIDR